MSITERELQVSPGPLVGTVVLPGDKSVSHRVLLIGALAEGTSHARGLSDGQDVAHSADAVRALGARGRTGFCSGSAGGDHDLRRSPELE